MKTFITIILLSLSISVTAQTWDYSQFHETPFTVTKGIESTIDGGFASVSSTEAIINTTYPIPDGAHNCIATYRSMEWVHVMTYSHSFGLLNVEWLPPSEEITSYAFSYDDNDIEYMQFSSGQSGAWLTIYELAIEMEARPEAVAISPKVKIIDGEVKGWKQRK